MSIDQDSNGLPGLNPRRRTTKVNLGMAAALLVFIAVTAGVALWVARSQEVAPPVVSEPIRR